MGQLNQGQVAAFEYKNILTRAIGTEPSVEPTAHYTSIKTGDLFLLCSDGLTDHLHDSDIEALLIQHPSIDEAGKALVKLAKQRGGHDNITLVLVKVSS
jgi:protein phosphatase